VEYGKKSRAALAQGLFNISYNSTQALVSRRSIELRKDGIWQTFVR